MQSWYSLTGKCEKGPQSSRNVQKWANILSQLLAQVVAGRVCLVSIPVDRMMQHYHTSRSRGSGTQISALLVVCASWQLLPMAQPKCGQINSTEPADSSGQRSLVTKEACGAFQQQRPMELSNKRR